MAMNKNIEFAKEKKGAILKLKNLVYNLDSHVETELKKLIGKPLNN